MTPEDRQTIQDIVCHVELDLRHKQTVSERRLMILEVVLLPIAIVLAIIWPLPASGIALIPNLIIRGYQLHSHREL